MIRQVNPNLEIVEIAASRLGAIREETVFVGGCATGLLLTDAAAPPIRATRDVDVIVEVASLASYQRGHLPGDAANQARLSVILERLRSIASLQGV